MNGNLMHKKYANQKGEQICNIGKKKSLFQKFNLVNMNKSPRQIKTCDLCGSQARYLNNRVRSKK